MATRPTFSDFYEAFKTEVQARQSNLSDWEDGSGLDALGGGAAMLGDEVMAGTTHDFAALFIDTADEADLDALVLDRYGGEVSRDPATFSVGRFRVTRGSSVIPSVVNIPAGSVVHVNTDDGVIAATVNADSIIPSSETFADVEATASVAGREGNFATTATAEFASALADDATATVSIPERFVGGAPAENDASLRDKARQHYTTLRRGTKSAVDRGASAVAGVHFATVDESLAHPADGGVVRVYVGDIDGRANSTLVGLVETELLEWFAAGIRFEVYAATREETDLALTVFAERGADKDTLRAAVLAALSDLDGQREAGDSLIVERVSSAAIRAHRDVRYARVTTPTADVAPSSVGHALRVPTTRLEVTFAEVS